MLQHLVPGASLHHTPGGPAEYLRASGHAADPRNFNRFVASRYFRFLTHGMCRYDHFEIWDLFFNILFFLFGPTSPQKVIFGSHGLHFLLKSPYVGRTDLYLLVQSSCMDRTDPIFPEKVPECGS